MPLHEFISDELDPRVSSWFYLIDQARKGSDADYIPSFLEIINQIASELTTMLNNPLETSSINSIFMGISLLSYLNDRYAIEKVMMFAKGRCRVSLPLPIELISKLKAQFSDRIELYKSDIWTNVIGNLMILILNKDFSKARLLVASNKQKFQEKLEAHDLSIIEGIFYILIRSDLIPTLVSNLNYNWTEHADSPFYLYFSILKNLVNEIQIFQQEKKSALLGLWNLFNGFSEIDKSNT